MLPFHRFKALTFDCYGTLIDWETGLRAALGRLGFSTSDGDEPLLQAFADAEARAESASKPFAEYKDVLREVHAELSARFQVRLDTARPYALADSIRDWPAFADTAAALAELRRRFKRVIVSNIDRDLFAHSLPKLGVTFDAIITAQDVRSYKPAPGHFRRALEVLQLPAAEVLHVAQSLYHDIRPARELGFTTVWVNRRGNAPGSGATAPAVATPDLTIPSLQALADLTAAVPTMR
jgi:2-haloacid dehalogenase